MLLSPLRLIDAEVRSASPLLEGQIVEVDRHLLELGFAWLRAVIFLLSTAGVEMLLLFNVLPLGE
jgi:hypothetical protein